MNYTKKFFLVLLVCIFYPLHGYGERFIVDTSDYEICDGSNNFPCFINEGDNVIYETILDLPLCTEVESGTNLKDCVNKCEDFEGSIHGTDCVNFCSESSVEDCIVPSCHKISDPIPNENCNPISCTLMSESELRSSRFDNNASNYCLINDKCHKFTKNKLRYVRFGTSNFMCILHNCSPNSEFCGIDEVNLIKNRPDDYSDEYQEYILGNNSVEEICIPMNCKPNNIKQHFICTEDTNGEQTVPDSLCETPCSNNLCTRTIDCNNESYSNERICTPLPVDMHDDEGINPRDELTNSWFYRPTPSDKAINEQASYFVMNEGNICYSKNNIFEDNEWGNNTFKSHFAARSPEKCEDARDNKLGIRGVGYAYLCSVGLNLYNEPSDDSFGYIQGYVKTNYNPDGSTTYNINTCLRYKNSGALNACGQRECRIDCFLGTCDTQWCGSDNCKTLTISDDNPKECEIKDSGDNLFQDKYIDKNCVSQMGTGTSVNSFVRVRAVKYGRRICSFLDLRGTLAYDSDYFNGSEKLENGTCISGSNDINSEDCVERFDTNSDSGLANRWRTVNLIRYIGNNNSVPGRTGFLDLKGRFFPSQECAKVELKSGPPRYYTNADINNSPSMFSPSIVILNSRIIKGGDISTFSDTGSPGATDFHMPEIEITFGSNRELINLEYDELESDIVTIQSIVNNIQETRQVKIKKVSDHNNNPSLCLYEIFYDLRNNIIQKKIDCVPRTKPYIDQKIEI